MTFEKATQYSIVDNVEMTMRYHEHEVRAAGFGDYVDNFKDREKRAMLRHAQRTIRGRAVSCTPYLYWRQYREVYSVHPSVTQSLVRLRSDVKIPAGIFRRLRHPNPLFVLPGEGVPIRHPDGPHGNVFAFFVTGAISADHCTSLRLVDAEGERIYTGANSLVDSHDGDANALRIMAVSSVLDGDVPQVDLCHLTIPLTEDFTLEELTERVASSTGFSWLIPSLGVESASASERGRDYVMTLAKVAVSHLLYAASRTAEISEGKAHRSPFRKRNSWDRAPKPSSVRLVGHKVGSVIADHVRREKGSGSSSSGSSGRTMAPHIRAPHAHLYRVGKGRQDVDIKFLGPISVNMDKYDGATTTFHKVR